MILGPQNFGEWVTLGSLILADIALLSDSSLAAMGVHVCGNGIVEKHRISPISRGNHSAQVTCWAVIVVGFLARRLKD